MQAQIFTLSLVAFSFLGCEQLNETSVQPAGSIQYAIVIDGEKTDTAYLYTAYKDKGATVVECIDGVIDQCPEFPVFAKTSGTANTRIPGTYLINYDADDAKGKPLATVTRTVHVIENKAGFLNGAYNVACSCTANIGDPSIPTITTDNYTANVATGSHNNSFELVALKIGPEYVVPLASLNGNSINVSYYSRNFDPASVASGTLSGTKTTFTIDTRAYQFSPLMTYACKSVYTKQLIIAEKSNK